MNELFENQKNTMINDYERRLRELEAKKTAEFDSMRNELQTKIEELMEQLRKERENMQGDAAQMQKKLQAEIEELKRQLQERTGQLEQASNTILERNDEIQRLRQQI